MTLQYGYLAIEGLFQHFNSISDTIDGMGLNTDAVLFMEQQGLFLEY